MRRHYRGKRAIKNGRRRRQKMAISLTSKLVTIVVSREARNQKEREMRENKLFE